MATFLPVTAITRSQRVRIAGQSITPGKISFIDIGLVDPPGGFGYPVTTSAGATKTGKLEEGKYYAYVVTSVGAGGGESEPSPIVTVKTVAEAEPSATVKWTKVAHAKKYRVYASPATGAAAAATAETEALKLIGETEAVELLDEGAGTTARGTAVPPAANTTSYNPGGGAFSTHKELQNHFSIGALQQLGGYTKSNLRFAPVSVPTTGFELKIESAKLKVGKTIVVDRNTGAVRTETAEFTSGTIESSGSTKIKLALVVYNAAANRVEVAGTEETTTETPTLALVTKLAEKELKSYQQLLYVVSFKAKVGTNQTALITGTSTPGLGDAANLPVIASVV